MDILLSLVVFLLIFGSIIFIHELGHYLAARAAKVRVLEFGLGIPPRAASIRRKNGEIWSLNWIPFGGFVRMHGEDSTTEKDPDAFNQAPIFWRILIVIAGVTMNFLMSLVLLTIGFMVGMQPLSVNLDPERADYAREQGWIEESDEVVIAEVYAETPAGEAGVEPGSSITELNGERVLSAEALGQSLQGIEGEIRLQTLNPDGEEQAFTLEKNEEGLIGIQYGQKVLFDPVQLGFTGAIAESVREMTSLTKLTVDRLGSLVVNIFRNASLPEDIGGPVRIADTTHDIVQIGDQLLLLQYVAAISLSIAILNILPFPALDGGRLVFLLVELVARRRVAEEYEGYVHLVGFAFLMLLIVLVTYNDIMQIFFS